MQKKNCINIYDAYEKILFLTNNSKKQKVVKKDKLFDELMETDEKDTILKLLLTPNEPEREGYNFDSRINITSKNIILFFVTKGYHNPAVFEENIQFIKYVEQNNLIDNCWIDCNLKETNIIHEIFEIPLGNILVSGASLCDMTPHKRIKDYGIISINIYPDTHNKNCKVIVSGIISKNFSRYDFEKEIFGDFKYKQLPNKNMELTSIREDKGGMNKYDEYDWFAYALYERLSSLIINFDYEGDIQNDIHSLRINGMDNEIIEKLRIIHILKIDDIKE